MPSLTILATPLQTLPAPTLEMFLFLPWGLSQHPSGGWSIWSGIWGVKAAAGAGFGCKQGPHTCEVDTAQSSGHPCPSRGVGGSVCSPSLLLGFALVLLMEEFPSSPAFGVILVFHPPSVLLQGITRDLGISLWGWGFLAALHPRRQNLSHRCRARCPEPGAAPAARTSSSWRGLLLVKKRPLLVTFCFPLAPNCIPTSWMVICAS